MSIFPSRRCLFHSVFLFKIVLFLLTLFIFCYRAQLLIFLHIIAFLFMFCCSFDRFAHKLKMWLRARLWNVTKVLKSAFCFISATLSVSRSYNEARSAQLVQVFDFALFLIVETDVDVLFHHPSFFSAQPFSAVAMTELLFYHPSALCAISFSAAAVIITVDLFHHLFVSHARQFSAVALIIAFAWVDHHFGFGKFLSAVYFCALFHLQFPCPTDSYHAPFVPDSKLVFFALLRS